MSIGKRPPLKMCLLSTLERIIFPRNWPRSFRIITKDANIIESGNYGLCTLEVCLLRLTSNNRAEPAAHGCASQKASWLLFQAAQRVPPMPSLTRFESFQGGWPCLLLGVRWLRWPVPPCRCISRLRRPVPTGTSGDVPKRRCVARQRGREARSSRTMAVPAAVAKTSSPGMGMPIAVNRWIFTDRPGSSVAGSKSRTCSDSTEMSSTTCLPLFRTSSVPELTHSASSSGAASVWAIC